MEIVISKVKYLKKEMKQTSVSNHTLQDETPTQKDQVDQQTFTEFASPHDDVMIGPPKINDASYANGYHTKLNFMLIK